MRVYAFFCLVLAGCGSEAPPMTELVLGPAFDVTGVARILPDGEAATELVGFSFSLEGLNTSGGAVVGKLKVGAEQISLQGDFDSKTGNFSFASITAVLTASQAETVRQLGGTGFDGTPEDAVADDLTGFLETRLGARVAKGQFIAASRAAGRPAAPDPAKISAIKASLGVARVTAPAGTFPAKVGIELFSYALAPGAPGFTLAQATAEGSLDATVPAVPGDRIAVRLRQVGVASEAKLIEVRE